MECALLHRQTRAEVYHPWLSSLGGAQLLGRHIVIFTLLDLKNYLSTDYLKHCC
ncbi:hypothetical protein CIPAW_13G053700 [Carya illinoinensis]|uniref:Uncharacterized protein n=1 Tax=Carya illinoinensis TaxID=32201 RepID=A0A8T1NPU4_CARIL|nr:hypothetical protein CIPAW_13G053700 [Carya illinoinensis]